MTSIQEQQALNDIYASVPTHQPSELELLQMFEAFLKTQYKEQGEEIPNLPRGFGQ